MPSAVRAEWDRRPRRSRNELSARSWRASPHSRSISVASDHPHVRQCRAARHGRFRAGHLQALRPRSRDIDCVRDARALASVTMETDPTLSILIVESDVLVRHRLAEYLRECGYQVLEALSAEHRSHTLCPWRLRRGVALRPARIPRRYTDRATGSDRDFCNGLFDRGPLCRGAYPLAPRSARPKQQQRMEVEPPAIRRAAPHSGFVSVTISSRLQRGVSPLDPEVIPCCPRPG